MGLLLNASSYSVAGHMPQGMRMQLLTVMVSRHTILWHFAFCDQFVGATHGFPEDPQLGLLALDEAGEISSLRLCWLAFLSDAFVVVRDSMERSSLTLF